MWNKKIAILGAGNIGTSIAKGIVLSGEYKPAQITLNRRKIEFLKPFEKEGFIIESDNRISAKSSEIIILSVEPSQIDLLLEEISSEIIPDTHICISVVSGITIEQIKGKLGKSIQVVRAMPNTALAINESMTCLTCQEKDHGALEVAFSIFNKLGETILINEKLMSAATALGACGVAFFLRAIRAASQGGIEIGFGSNEAIKIAAQAAKGASSLLLLEKNHPEFEIDKVTTPRGCTIAGLNKMEHEGFSAAMIDGITTSAEKATALYFKK